MKPEIVAMSNGCKLCTGCTACMFCGSTPVEEEIKR